MKRLISLLLILILFLSSAMPAFADDEETVINDGEVLESDPKMQWYLTSYGRLYFTGQYNILYINGNVVTKDGTLPVQIVDIPACVTSIIDSKYPFANLNLYCPSMSQQQIKIIFHGDTPPKIGAKSFANSSNLTIYHPDTTAWTTFLSGLSDTDEDNLIEFCGGELYADKPFGTLEEVYTQTGSVNPTCTEAGSKTLQCPGCKQTYETTVPAKGHSFNGNSAVCTNGCGAVDPSCTISVITSDHPEGQKCESLSAAIAAAASGSTLKLYGDVSASGEDIIPTGSVVLDLNGHTLQVSTLNLLDPSACIIDSSNDGNGGGGVLQLSTSGAPQLPQSNSQLPLYDSQAGGYRFYKYDVMRAAPSIKTAEIEGTQRSCIELLYQVRIYNTSGYGLINSGNTNNLTIDLAWDGGSYDFKLSSEVLSQYAGLCSQNSSATKYMIKIQIYGYEERLAGKELKITPGFNNSGVNVGKEAAQYSIQIAK